MNSKASINEQRREVASKLRNLAVVHCDDGDFVDRNDVLELIEFKVYDDYFSRIDVLELADLIDRPTCRYLPAEIHSWFDENDEEHDEPDVALDDGCDCCTCTNCGYEMAAGDMGWFDEEPGEHGGWKLKARFKYCPDCGAEVVE